MKYYWCVNCGFHGEFTTFRQRGVKCECCDYDGISELDLEEWAEYGKKHHEYQKKDKFYMERLRNVR